MYISFSAPGSAPRAGARAGTLVSQTIPQPLFRFEPQMIIRSSFALAIAAALAATPAAAQSHPAPADSAPTRTLLVVMRGDDGTVLALDSASVSRRADARYAVRMVTQFAGPVEAPNGAAADMELDDEELDCARGRTRGTSSTLYNGEQVVDAHLLPHDWTAVGDARLPTFQATCTFLGSSFASRMPTEIEMEEAEQMPEIVNVHAVSASLAREYPQVLRNAGMQGDVNLRFRVLADGTVDRPTVTVMDATNIEFAEAARRVALTMRFKPARVNKTPVNAWVNIPILFRLSYGVPEIWNRDAVPFRN